MAPNPRLQRMVSQGSARVVPLFLAGIVGYVTWDFVALLAVNHLIHPPSNLPHHKGAGIALLVIYFILLLLMVVSYARIIQTVITNPGYVLRPSRRHRRRSTHRRSSASSRVDSGHGEKRQDAQDKGYMDRTAVLDGREQAPPGLEEFFSRDVFECDIDGLPRWCAVCQHWKPDRSHHSSEINRCVHKMDHYCPWAGGMVAETNFNFFIQFCLYANLFCMFVLITTAYYIAKGGEDELSHVTWIVMLAFATLFMLFSAGMAINSLHFAFLNSTTVENIARGRNQHFAVYSPQLSSSTGGGYDATPQFGTVTYPLTTDAYDPTRRRTFAILAAPGGINPYRLPSMWENFRQVMGDHWYEWILPIRHSPCADHGFSFRDDEAAMGDRRPMYPISPVLQQMKADAGLEDSQRKHKKRKRSSRSRGSHGQASRRKSEV